MGTFFRRIFEDEGWDVEVTGSRSRARNVEVAGRSEIVMVSVPIRVTAGVIGEIAPAMGPHQLLCDLTSLKIGPVTAMLGSRADVLGLHPMFGPSVSSLRGQTIVVTPARCRGGLCRELLDLFERRGARITCSTPEEHDRMMAVIQVMTHFATLSLAEGIRLLGTDLHRAFEFTSPVYRLELGLIGRLLGQDPELYCDMIRENPFSGDALECFSRGVEMLRSSLAEREREAFIRIFRTDAEKFAEYIPWATEQTDLLIRAMVDP